MTLTLFGTSAAPTGVPTRDRWRTPRALVTSLRGSLGLTFDLDLAAEDSAHVAPRYYTAEIDALTQRWHGRCWCNPPFSTKERWVRKALEEFPHQRQGYLALLLPFSSGCGREELTARAHTLIDLTPRVEFVPPPGVDASTPNAVPHRIWVLGTPPLWRGLYALDWQSGHVYRRPVIP